MISFRNSGLQMLSDGESLVLLEPQSDITLIANSFFVDTMSVDVQADIVNVSTISSSYRQQYMPGLMSTRINLGITVSGHIEHKEGGIIRNIFDLYSVRDLLRQVENKVGGRG